jgi:hypothetical protein
MRGITLTIPSTTIGLCLLLIGLVPSAPAAVRPLDSDRYWLHRVTCDYPVRLTRDCSIWHGATREIAFDGYRMSVAADADGRTLLLAGIRPAPDHNGTGFRRPGRDRGERGLRLVDRLHTELSRQGIHLERLQPVKHGRRIAGYFLEFSDNAYDVLRRYTVLESRHWLPQQAAGVTDLR